MNTLPSHVEVLTVPEAARILRVSRFKMYDLVKKNAIPAIRLGEGTIRIPKAAIDALIHGGSTLSEP
ncbi:hypothetical protein TPY_2782 [Sulfobacillus acidophilus TPY]|uniref:DNA binding domain protein, excisionase family n=1 Tax=Sulfobacillus acidophilus (strain ATCC 700253 / DSM 10332 / NAL) TaxID=679936 RepID=G8TU09_SULAD|nr:hypothetical protein TPY_2782 [Sulfobacillus acidophilus TPY]AEW04600.1 DNA binding domain protein, excisionase family [Sulfobacillus acidophilus DSM 10332]